MDKGSRFVKVHLNVDWNECGSHEKGVPTLSYAVPFSWATGDCQQDIPFGILNRGSRNADLPALNFTMSRSEEGAALEMVSWDTYGWRCMDNAIALTILRGSHEPDPVPEKGMCESEFAIGFLGRTYKSDALKYARNVFQEFTVVSNGFHHGTLPFSSSLLRQEGGDSIIISSIKQAEDSDGIVIRLFEVSGADAVTNLTFSKPVKCAAFVDILERDVDGNVIVIDGNTAEISVPANTIKTGRISF